MPVERSSVIIVDREFKAETAEDVFYQYKAEIIRSLRENLIKHDKDQPGKLIQSIDVNIYEKDNKITFELEMEDYWKFVDAGVDGTDNKWGSPYHYKNRDKSINIGAVLDFIKVRGITKYKKPSGEVIYDINKNPKRINNLKNKTVKKASKQVSKESRRITMAWLMGRRIKRHGIKPTHFFTDVINDDLKARLTMDISKALKKDIEIDFKASIK